MQSAYTILHLTNGFYGETTLTSQEICTRLVCLTELTIHVSCHSVDNSMRLLSKPKMYSTFKSKPNSLETLVRIALTNRELAPGVAKQINHYRAGSLSTEQNRLLSILTDAIEDDVITIINVADARLLTQPVRGSYAAEAIAGTASSSRDAITSAICASISSFTI